MKIQRHQNTCKGFSLLEVTLVLAVVGVLVMGATRLYPRVMTQRRVNQTIRLAPIVWSAVARWQAQYGRQRQLSWQQLQQRGWVDGSMSTSPWGGTMKLQYREGSQEAQWLIPNVPKQACALLHHLLNAQGMDGVCRANHYQARWQVAA